MKDGNDLCGSCRLAGTTEKAQASLDLWVSNSCIDSYTLTEINEPERMSENHEPAP